MQLTNQHFDQSIGYIMLVVADVASSRAEDQTTGADFVTHFQTGSLWQQDISLTSL